jgi:cellulose synthase/poly-beta-1,6-N-acetylglucosamine synthase-like glycosyltransferase
MLALPWAMLVISFFIIILTIYSHLKAKFSRKFNSDEITDIDSIYTNPRRIAFLIASKNGENTIADVINSAKRNRRQIFVVSDGSTDSTARVARQAGATVLNLRKNIGKPSALHRAYKQFNLSKRFDAIAILDDDVIVDKDFIKHTKLYMKNNTAITVGKNITRWPDSKKWNVWLATRAYSYWSYQFTLRHIQSTFNVMNCISGSNSLYRTKVLDKVLHSKTPYIVDDTYWTLETHRLNLGTIVYAPEAVAYIQDPTSFRDWYKQNIRWMWGTFQGILGHEIGTQINKFHISYIMLMTQWVFYILSAPVIVWLLIVSGLDNLFVNLLILMLGYGVWIYVASVALNKKRLVLFTPAIIVTDFIFRYIMVVAFFKALNNKTVESCTWNSPKRFSQENKTSTQNI